MNNVKAAAVRDFEADRKICDAASAGPWYWVAGNPQYRDLGIIRSETEGDVCDFGNCAQYYPSAGNEPYETDIVFITEARTGWPAALDRIAELEAEIERLKDALSDERSMREAVTFDLEAVQDRLTDVVERNLTYKEALYRIRNAAMSMFLSLDDMARYMKRNAREALSRVYEETEN